jgi:hydrogenase expression/formation protein HypC
MCHAIPGKVVSIDGENASIDYGGLRKIANISLIEGISVGDYVLVHAGFAIQKYDKVMAEENYKAFSELLDGDD